METLVLKLISSYLKEYVNNFRKEQISLNFLRGQGVMKDLDLNVDLIDDIIFGNDYPSLKFTKIRINTLSVDADFMALKSKPVIVYIDEVFIEVSEVVDLNRKNKTFSSKKAGYKYGLYDRVWDSLSFEVNKISIAIRTLGRLKTNTVGPWTPPVLLVELCGNRYQCCNHNFVEADLEECIRLYNTKRPFLYIYKKMVSKKVNFYLVNPGNWASVAEVVLAGIGHKDSISKLNRKLTPYDPFNSRPFVIYQILYDTSLELNLCMKRRLENCLLFGFETSVKFPELARLILKQSYLTEFINLLCGLNYALYRKDAVEYVFGPNPHHEVEGFRSESSSNFSIGMGSSSISSSSNEISHSKFSRDSLEKDDLAHLDLLEASMLSGGKSYMQHTHDYNAGGKGSWNNDEDPPRMRTCFAIEVQNLVVSLIYSEVSGSSHSIYKGADLNVKNFVYLTIRSEQSKVTESVSQISISSFSLEELKGSNRTSIFKSGAHIDANGVPLNLKFIPRGIKEHSDFDPENFHGVSLAYRKDSNWPPPPVNQGVSKYNDCIIGLIDFTVNLDSLNTLISYFAGAWDERYYSGSWGDTALGRLESMHAGGSSETLVVFMGFTCNLYSDFIQLKDTSKYNYSNALIPPHVLFEIGLSSLVWKHQLTLNSLNDALGDSDNEGMLGKPHRPEDLSNVIKRIREMPEIDLMCDRFEVSVTGISLKFSDSNVKSEKPAYRTLIKPFNVLYFVSIDPHPDKEPILPESKSFFSPYNRVFYWGINSSTIASTLVTIENLAINCSLLDITQVVNIIIVIMDWVSDLFPDGIYSHPEVAPTIIEPSNSIFVFKVGNLKCNLLQNNGDRYSQSIDQTRTSICLEVCSLAFISEWADCAPLWNSPDIIVKLLVGGISIRASEMPAFFMAHSNIQECLHVCWELPEKGIINQMNNLNPVILLRYEAKASLFESKSEEGEHYINASKKSDILSSPVSRLSIYICKDVTMISVIRHVENMVSSIMSEVLQGHGIIYTPSGSLFDNCIFGYWLNIYNLLKEKIFPKVISSDQLSDPSIYSSHCSDYDCGDTSRSSAISSINDRTLEIVLSTDGIELGLVDPLERDGKYVSIGMIIDHGLTKVSFSFNRPEYFNSWGCSKQQLTFYHMDVSRKQFERIQFSTPFLYSGEINRSAMSAYELGINFKLENMFINIETNQFAIASEIFSRMTNQLNKSTSTSTSMILAAKRKFADENFILLISNNNESGVNCEGNMISSLKLENSDSNSLTHTSIVTELNNERSINIANHSSLINRILSPKHEKLSILDYKDILSRKSHFTTNLLSSIRYLTQEVSKELSTIHSLNEKLYSESLLDISLAEKNCASLEEMCEKLEKMIILTGCDFILHYGWIRRSRGFSIDDYSISQTRNWAVLNRNSILFLQQPYSSKIDFEIKLENGDIEVIDPDERSTRLWFRSTKDFSVLVADYDSMDEKDAWKSILASWLSSHTGSKTKKRPSLTMNSLTSSLFDNNSGNNSKFNHDHSPADQKNSSNIFSSAAKFVTKRLSIGGGKQLNSQEGVQDGKNRGIVAESSNSRFSNSNLFLQMDQIIADPSKFRANIGDIMDEVQSIRVLSRNYSDFFKESKSKLLISKIEEQINFQKFHDLLMSLTIGLIGLDYFVSEIINMSAHLNIQNNAIIASLSKQYELSKYHGSIMKKLSDAALKSKLECESVLEAVSFQNLSSIISMSKQYEDLILYYNDLRFRDHNKIINSSSNLQDVVKNLSTSLRGVEALLRKSDAEISLYTLEKKEILSEANHVKEKIAQVKLSGADMVRVGDDSRAKLRGKIEIAKADISNLETERDNFKEKYERLLKLL